MIAALSLAAALNTLPVATGLTGTWAGPVLNCYNNQCMPGYSWFEVDRQGKYHGWTIAKKPGADCLSFDEDGWTGQLYRLGKHTIYALNDGADDGYILQVSRDKQSASSTYIGAAPGVIESNHFYRGAPGGGEALLQVVGQEMCQ